MSGSTSSLRRSDSSRASRSPISRGRSCATAARENCRPITAARSRIVRSSGRSRSMRAASSAWMVGGISMSASAMLVVQRSPSRLSAPSCTSMRTSSPTNKGLPSLVARTRPAMAAGSSSAPSTFAARRVAAPASRPASVTTSATSPPRAASDERVSRSSGRAATKTSSGTPLLHCTRCSVRSSRSGSAHCTSSSASTTGCACASAARRRRTTKKVSSGDAGAPASSPATPAAMRARSGSAVGSAPSIAARSVSPLAPSSIRRVARSVSASGAKVAPPAGSQRAVRTVARSPSRRANSPSSRDLPSPGEPRIAARRGPGSATAASYTEVSRRSSSSRPTNAIAGAPAGRSSDTTR